MGAAELGALGQGSIGLDPSLTFTTFVTGSANVLASNAAQRMAATETPQFAPLYLKAATGQGKTHLLHAIGHAYLAAHPRARIFYCSAERFMVEFVQALRQNQTIEFKARLRGFDLLLVDDIQFIIGKASAQEELLYTIDALLAEGKRLVFAADRAPQALDGVEQRLLSRLSMGLVADIQPADIELRRAILEHRLQRFSPTHVPADVVEFLARTINRNVRELVGGLNKLIAYAQLTGQAQRAVHQACIFCGDRSALQPHARNFQVLPEGAALKGLLRVGQAQRSDVPGHQLGRGREFKAGQVEGVAAAVGQGFERQPFQPCAVLHMRVYLLRGQACFASVKARGAGRGDQAMRACPYRDLHVERVAAHQAAGRVHQHVVTDAVAFGVQALQDAQRAVVRKAGHAALGFQAVVQVQAGDPAHATGSTLTPTLSVCDCPPCSTPRSGDTSAKSRPQATTT